jgi:NitT/TauT family transport system substrate-binding protein
MHVLSRRGVLLFGAVALMPRSRARAADTTPVKVAGLAEDSATTVLYGIQSGLFARYNLAVDMQSQQNGPATMSGVAGDSYQIGKSSTPPLVAAHNRGLPFVIVAPAGLYTAKAPIAALLVGVDSPIKKAADLNGKTIATGALNDIHSLATRAWIDKNGGDSTAVKFVEIPLPEIAVAIAGGRVDAGSANEPALSAALAAGKVRVLGRNFDAIAPRFMYTAWFTTTQYATANPDVVRKFAQALKVAAEYVNSHDAQTVDLIAKFTLLDPAQVRKMTRVEQGTSLDPRLIQPVIDAMVKYKFTAQAFDPRLLIASGLS